MTATQTQAGDPAQAAASARDKVPVYEKAAWAAGGAADAVLTTSIGQMALPIYNMGLGLSASLVGVAMAIPRFLDAFLDPIMGNLSDNTRSRWGRRRPYIAIGGIFATILYWLTWCPPRSWSTWGIFSYLILMSTLFYVFYTIFLIPHAALGFELTGDTVERTRVMTWRSIFGSIGGLFLPSFLFWSKSSLWSPKGDAVIGVRYVTAIAGMVMLLAILSTAFFCKERVSAQNQKKIDLLPALKYTLTNGPFMIVIGIIMLTVVACFLAGPFEIYVIRYQVAGGIEKQGFKIYAICGFLYGALGLIYSPLISLVAARRGKRSTMQGGIILASLAFLSTLIFYRPTQGQWSLALPFLSSAIEIPKAAAWIMICKVMLNPGLTCVWILGFSMIADVCDVDELKTGLRREGMFGAMYNTIVIKFGISAVTAITGLALDLCGYNPKAEPARRVIDNIRYSYAIVPVALLAIAFALTLIYPLTEKKMREVRRQLAERKQGSTEGFN